MDNDVPPLLDDDDVGVNVYDVLPLRNVAVVAVDIPPPLDDDTDGSVYDVPLPLHDIYEDVYDVPPLQNVVSVVDIPPLDNGVYDDVLLHLLRDVYF